MLLLQERGGLLMKRSAAYKRICLALEGGGRDEPYLEKFSKERKNDYYQGGKKEGAGFIGIPSKETTQRACAISGRERKAFGGQRVLSPVRGLENGLQGEEKRKGSLEKRKLLRLWTKKGGKKVVAHTVEKKKKESPSKRGGSLGKHESPKILIRRARSREKGEKEGHRAVKKRDSFCRGRISMGKGFTFRLR